MLSIREETPEDIDDIDAVHLAAFPIPAEARLVQELRASGKLVLSLIARWNTQLIGHVAFTRVYLDGDLCPGIGLASVAVLPRYQNRGICSNLIQRGLDDCRRKGFGFVVVLGSPRYYERFGFVPANSLGLQNPFDAADHFLVKRLRDNALQDTVGLITYEPEFNHL